MSPTCARLPTPVATACSRSHRSAGCARSSGPDRCCAQTTSSPSMRRRHRARGPAPIASRASTTSGAAGCSPALAVPASRSSTAASTGSPGPRLETPAEIRLVAEHADVIGMTVATECVVAGELGIRYAALCVVDNLANGVGETELTLGEIEAEPRVHRAGWSGADASSAGVGGELTESSSIPDDGALAVSDANLDGTGRPALRGRRDRRARSGRQPPPGDEVLDAVGHGAGSRSRQRAHPRGDDALPRLRRRPAADGVARASTSGRSRSGCPTRTSTGERGWPASR